MAQAEPARVILDTDFATDVDDVGALAVLHALADRGEAEILGVMHDTSYPFSAPAIRAINAYYGRPDLPVGRFAGAFAPDEADGYVKAIAERFAANRLTEPVPDAVELYRTLLSGQPDRSVTVVSVGFLTNLRGLLASPGGADLIRAKVKSLVVMGGGYPRPKKPEFNFAHLGAGPVTRAVIRDWPTPVTFSGVEIGIEILTGAGLARTPADNPVRAAYAAFHHGVVRDRWSWDQTAVLAAVRGAAPLWTIKDHGRNVVGEDGSNAWDAHVDGPHAYLVAARPAAEVAAQIEALMTQAPRVKGAKTQKGPAGGRAFREVVEKERRTF